MSLAWIGLGANLGRPKRTLSSALLALDRLDRTRVIAVSPAYWTPPWGVLEQPEFLNAVACVRTEMAPSALLHALLDIESRLGRERSQQRWGPRMADLDLLLVDDQVVDSAELTLPHPRLHERAFVLLPLADVAPGLDVPGHGCVQDLLDALPDVDMDGIRSAGELDWRRAQ
jgi:2-amino-4-hydroxy-6-hydroxymethyldihydropteridine diphosphokinase